MSTSDEFAVLRGAHRRFVWPTSVLFVSVYLVTVWLAGYRPGWMATPAIGGLAVGILVVLVNFAVTLAVTVAYRYYVTSRLDPLAEACVRVPEEVAR